MTGRVLGQLGDDKATINGFESIMGELGDELNDGFGRQAANDIADAKGNVDKLAHLETLKSDFASLYNVLESGTRIPRREIL